MKKEFRLASSCRNMGKNMGRNAPLFDLPLGITQVVFRINFRSKLRLEFNFWHYSMLSQLTRDQLEAYLGQDGSASEQPVYKGGSFRGRTHRETVVLAHHQHHTSELLLPVRTHHASCSDMAHSSLWTFSRTDVPRDKTTGMPLAYGFVEFASRADAWTAMQKMDGCQLDAEGHCVNVSWSNASKPPGNRPRAASKAVLRFMG